MKKIREHYLETYETDELGVEIRPNVTFNGLWKCLCEGKDVYSFLGVEDSLVRERCFLLLSELKKWNYNKIYYKWLEG